MKLRRGAKRSEQAEEKESYLNVSRDGIEQLNDEYISYIFFFLFLIDLVSFIGEVHAK